jgi:hypothetical protein
MKWVIGLKYLLVWERLWLFDRFGYAEMATTKNYTHMHVIYRCTNLLRSLSYVHLVENRDMCSRRCLHSWMTRRRLFLSNMDENIIYELDIHHHRNLYSFWDDCLYCTFFLYTLVKVDFKLCTVSLYCSLYIGYNGFWAAMCISVMKRPRVMLKTFK